MISAVSRRLRSNGSKGAPRAGILMRTYFLYCLLLGFSLKMQAQDTTAVKPAADSNARHSVAIFLPLYLDSAFDATGNYRYDKNFPKFINPGLEFYEGAQLALDSLEAEDAR